MAKFERNFYNFWGEIQSETLIKYFNFNFNYSEEFLKNKNWNAVRNEAFGFDCAATRQLWTKMNFGLFRNNIHYE